MTVAKFQELRGDIVGIVRVYDSQDTDPPAPYKFFTVAVIEGDRAEIVGLADARITPKDANHVFESVALAAKENGLEVKTISWDHNGKRHKKRINI